MKYLTNDIKKRLEEKLAKLNELRPLPASAVKKLQEQFKIEMAYNSNAIEGNSLTLRETYLVITEGLTIKNKPLKDHLEAKDHYEALDYLFKLVENKKSVDISEEVILNLHKIVVLDTEKDWAGHYRNSWVMITGTNYLPPEASDVPSLMREVVNWFEQNKKKLHPVELAAILHHKLVYVHPFFDGNGRTARLVMNLVLMSRGYPLVVILKNDRRRYYDLLQKADDGDWAPFVMFISQAVERTLNIYLREEKYLSLSALALKFGYPAKYLNLLSRSGKLEAHKEGRNWVASPEAVQRYLENRKRKR